MEKEGFVIEQAGGNPGDIQGNANVWQWSLLRCIVRQDPSGRLHPQPSTQGGGEGEPQVEGAEAGPTTPGGPRVGLAWGHQLLQSPGGAVPGRQRLAGVTPPPPPLFLGISAIIKILCGIDCL